MPVRVLAPVTAALLLASCAAATDGTPSSTASSAAASAASSAASSGATPPSGSTSAHLQTPVDAGLGALPTYLPSGSARTTAHGTTTRPALSYPGPPVIAGMDGGDVTVAVDGPTVPKGTALGAGSVAATFTIRLSGATAEVDLSHAHLDQLDSTGGVHPLTVTGMPRTLAPGTTATITASATVPAGEGLLRLYPHGTVAVAAWDYVAETD